MYWRGLNAQLSTSEDVVVRVDGEDDVAIAAPAKKEMKDMRLRQLGRIVEELHKSGNEGRDEYTDDLLKKRMDTFERSYIAQRSARTARG
jgi:hypothetical protein